MAAFRFRKSQLLRLVSVRQSVVIRRLHIWHFVECGEKFFAVATFGPSGDVAFVAPDAYGLCHRQADELLQGYVLARGQFLGLLEHRLRNLGFDGRHIVSRNFISICAGVMASTPNFSTPAKFLKLCVTT